MDFKIGFQSETRCTTCLSLGRKLSPLGEFTSMYEVLAGPFYELPKLARMYICWECRAIMQKVILFQNKVRTAAIALNEENSNIKSLSTLSTAAVKEYSQILYSESDIDREPGLKTAVLLDEDDLAQNDDYFDIAESDEIKLEIKEESAEVKIETNNIAVESLEIKQDSSESGINKYTKKGLPLWAINRKLEVAQPKYKLVNVKKASKKDMYHQIRITPTELKTCMDMERASGYYTKRRYKCESCIIGFASKKAFLEHKKMKHSKGAGDVVCDVCGTRFQGKNNLVTHIRSHYFKYECRLCRYTCYNVRNQLAHYHADHGRVVQCLSCELRFVNRNEFYKHFREWHEKFICDHCGYLFKMRYSIVNHLRRHHKQHGRVACPLCEKTFANGKGYWMHKTLQHPARDLPPAYCVECDKHFKHVYAYKGHINRKHKPPKPTRKSRHPCPSCDKSFSKNIYMRNHHDYVHLKVYKNRCDPCGKKFLRPAELVRHNRQVHEGIPAPKNKLCYICGRGFATNKILANHIRVHTGERPFECPRCPARFTQRTALVTHTRNVHHDKYTHSND